MYGTISNYNISGFETANPSMEDPIAMTDKIRIGLIGCGRIADLHAKGYENRTDRILYAVCDNNPETAAQRKQAWGAVKSYTDYRQMLADSEIDAVEILTPHPLHEEMVIESMNAGKHVALQKPMTISLESADRMLAAVRPGNLVFKVTDNYLFYPPIVLAKELIKKGKIGTPTNLRIKMIAGGDGGWTVPAATWQWRMQESAEGRGIQTFDHGHHLWAAAWYLLGGIECVSSWIDSADGVVDSPAVMMWKYQSGAAYGMCEYSYGPTLRIPTRYYANDEWIEITGSEGIISVNRCTGNIVEGPAVSLFNANGWRHYDSVPADWSEGFIGATDNFVSAIRGEADPLLTGDQAREILRLNLAFQKSSRQRREVYPEELDASFPKLFSWNRKRTLRKRMHPGKTIFERLGFGAKDGRYAEQAESLTDGLMEKFDAAAIGDWEAQIGLDLLADGTTPALQYHLTIRAGKATLEKGCLPESPSLLLRVPTGTWAAILLKKKRIETAFLQNRLKIEGQAQEGLKLRDAFGI
jgi:predicted dehydrogenase